MKLILILILATSCASNDKLKYSKKLIKEGHNSLYVNGAIEFPYSSVKLIPPGDKAFTISSQLVGSSAKKSFYKAWQNANESFVIIKKGSIHSYNVSRNAANSWKKVTDKVDKDSTENSIWLVKKSSLLGLGIIKKGHDLSVKNSNILIEYADSIPEKSILMSYNIGVDLEKKIKNSDKSFDKASEKNLDKRNSRTKFIQGRNAFIKGYLALPSNILAAKENMDTDKIKTTYQNNTQNNKRLTHYWSQYSWGLVKNSVVNYKKNIKDSLSNAEEEFANESYYGVTFSLFKSIGWLIDAGLWQGIIKPISNLTAGSIGYVTTNGIIYPTLVVGDAAFASANYVVEATKFSSEVSYHIFAPTVKLAVASVISSVDAIGENIEYGSIKIAKQISKGSLIVAKKISQPTVIASGYAGKLTTKYIIVPANYVGTNIVSTSTGIVVGAAGATSGVAYGFAGKTIKVISPIVETSVVAGGTVVGSIGSTTYAGALTLYHAGASVIVPTGKALGGGVVLTYGMLSQLSAHTILAMGDVSYVVLSMEGPNWILYGIKGKVDKQDHVQGTVIDLDKLQKEGEEILKIPLTQEEVDLII